MFRRKKHKTDWEIVETEEDLKKKRELEDEWYLWREKYYKHFNECFPTMMIHSSLKGDIEMIKTAIETDTKIEVKLFDENGGIIEY